MPFLWNRRGLLFLFGWLMAGAVLAPQAGASLRVVVSIKPVHSLVAGLMRGTGRPVLLIRNGTPHGYSLRPADARAMQKADLFIWVGPHLETFLVEPLKSLGAPDRLLVLESLPGLTRYARRGAAHSKETSVPPGASRSKSVLDPHLWLDPANALVFIDAILARLVAIDPVRAKHYRANHTALKQRLENLIKDLKSELAPCRHKPFITYHDAYQYFENRFGLSHAGSVMSDAHRRPGVRHLRDLTTRIKREHIRCVFSQARHPSKLVPALIAGTRARTAPLDPDGAGLKEGPELYFSLLKQNARAFRSCLGVTD